VSFLLEAALALWELLPKEVEQGDNAHWIKWAKDRLNTLLLQDESDLSTKPKAPEKEKEWKGAVRGSVHIAP
jgi:hypothetical protein